MLRNDTNHGKCRNFEAVQKRIDLVDLEKCYKVSLLLLKIGFHTAEEQPPKLKPKTPDPCVLYLSASKRRSCASSFFVFIRSMHYPYHGN